MQYNLIAFVNQSVAEQIKMSKHDACHTFIDIFVRNCTEYQYMCVCARACSRTSQCIVEDKSENDEKRQKMPTNPKYSDLYGIFE